MLFFMELFQKRALLEELVFYKKGIFAKTFYEHEHFFYKKRKIISCFLRQMSKNNFSVAKIMCVGGNMVILNWKNHTK